MACRIKTITWVSILLTGLAIRSAGAIDIVSTNAGLATAADITGITVAPDGSLLVHGWFVQVNDVPIRNVARFAPDGALDENWAPMPDLGVSSLALAGNSIYLAGLFESINGIEQRALAKVDTSTGALDPDFAPDPQGMVHDIALTGTTLYAGGAFDKIGGANRIKLAALDPHTGAARPGFTNGPEFGMVYTLDPTADGLGVGGLFFEIGGEPRLFIAKVAADSGDPLPTVFTNGADSLIWRMRGAGDQLYVTGYFERIDEVETPTLARLDRVTGRADAAWISGIDMAGAGGVVMDVAPAADGVFVGGDFTNYAGNARHNLVKVRLDNGAVIPQFAAGTDNTVNALAITDDGLLIGGTFMEVNDAAAFGLARLDPATGARDTGFNVRLTDGGTVYAALQLPDGGWILGGNFTLAREMPIPFLVRLAPDGTPVPEWQPQPAGSVRALALDGDNLYIGGSFNRIGTHAQTNLALISLATGLPDTNFTAGANNTVRTILLDDDALYAGGDFTVISGLERRRLARLARDTGVADAGFTADANNSVEALATDGEHIYAAGFFTKINAEDRGRIARVNPLTGTPDDAWQPNADRGIEGLDVTADAVYAGGNFDNIGGAARRRLARLNKTDGQADPQWNPGATGQVHVIRAHGDMVYVGGEISMMDGLDIANAGRLCIETGAPDQGWTPEINEDVNVFMFDGPYIALAGGFNVVNGRLQQCFSVLTHNPPQVELTAPTATWFQSVAEIDLQADARAGHGMVITQVVYYADGAMLAAATAAPYTAAWERVPEGHHTLWAVAYDQWGFSGTSAPLTVAVTPVALAVDFDGDGKADPALHVFDPDTGKYFWHVWLSGQDYRPTGPVLGDTRSGLAVAGDFDGDGKADPALWTVATVNGRDTGAWYVWFSSQEYRRGGPFYVGPASVTPVPADFDGDSKADPAVFTSDHSHNLWRVWQSGSDYADSGYVRLSTVTDGMPLAADFDGDGKADPAVVNAEGWRVWMSGNAYRLHNNGPVQLEAPVDGLWLAADFDGDGRADPAVYAPGPHGGWYVWLSTHAYRRFGPYRFTAP